MASSPLPYCNHLKKEDRVIDAQTRRPGKVAADVRENSRTVVVQFQGETRTRRIDVLNLRLLDNSGTPENVPPIDGEPPPRLSDNPGRAGAPEPRRRPPAANSALDALKAERAKIEAELAALENQFRVRKQERERLDRAIECLTAA